MGNSEVGHMTMGAGRVVYQELSRIDQSIASGEFECSGVFRSLTSPTDEGVVHVLGLLSPGGVHSHENHIFEAIKLLLKNHRRVVLHAILDGRDTPPKSAESSLVRAIQLASSNDSFSIGSVSGRYYAMDRDKRWDRTRKVYDLITQGKAEHCSTNPLEALNAAYDRGETDEFVTPTRIDGMIPIQDGDDCLFMNFRSDRARQLSRALVVDDPDIEFKRERRPNLRSFITATPYASAINASASHIENVDAIFKPETIVDSFGEVVAKAGMRQLRVAETEKYAHVTYFFSGGSEQEFTGETRRLLPSPKVATYDLQPEMSAASVSNVVVKTIEKGEFDAIVCNLANADMVGHTGNFAAAKQAVECLDRCIDSITSAVLASKSNCLITADHGNVEQMLDNANNQAHTAHTTGKVPCIYIGVDQVNLTSEGGLEDIAPTLLQMMRLQVPSAMTGQSLLN